MTKVEYNLDQILDIISSVIFTAKNRNIFVEFYIYSSSYKRYTSIDDIREQQINEKGIGMFVLYRDVEYYYYEEGYIINPLIKILKNKFNFDISCENRDNSKITIYGYPKNHFESAAYSNQSKEFFSNINNHFFDNIAFSISAEYEKIIVYSNDHYVFDGRVFQKLFVMKNRSIIDTYSTNTNNFVGNFFTNINKNYNEIPKSDADINFKYKNFIFLPKATGILIHEICGHMLEGDFYKKKNPFYNMIGLKIAPDFFTVYDDPMVLYDNIMHVDDEGYLLKKNFLIVNGVLKGIIGSKMFHLKHEKIPFFHQARRESYKCVSTGRAYCLCLQSDNNTLNSLIENEIDCLVIGSFEEAHYDSIKQIVSCVSSDVYLIENRTLVKVNMKIKISEKGNTLLSNIATICNDNEYSENMCYSSSGWVSNATYAPSVAIKNVKFTYCK